MSLKQKIQQDVVIPAEHLRGSHTTVAQVIASNEKANTVTIKYLNKEGYACTKSDVPVKIYNTAIIDWFPEEGEAVTIEQSDSYICVISKYEGSYASLIRGSTALKNDILGDSMNSVMAGMIL